MKRICIFTSGLKGLTGEVVACERDLVLPIQRQEGQVSLQGFALVVISQGKQNLFSRLSQTVGCTKLT